MSILDRDVAVMSGLQGDGVHIGGVGIQDFGRLMEDLRSFDARLPIWRVFIGQMMTLEQEARSCSTSDYCS